MPKHNGSGSMEWAKAAAKKLKGKSVADLEVLATVQFLNTDDNSELIFQAAMTALGSKSKSAHKRVYDKLAEMNENQGQLEVA